jgi:hypothetical protein
VQGEVLLQRFRVGNGFGSLAITTAGPGIDAAILRADKTSIVSKMPDLFALPNFERWPPV